MNTSSDEIMVWVTPIFGGPGIRKIPVSHYPDGMPLVDCEVGDVQRLLLRPSSIGSFMEAMFWVDALRARGRRTPDLILPCVPGARQDRLNIYGDQLFTLKSVAKEINSRRFPSVTVIDPHSDVAPALIDRCCVIHADACVSPPYGKYAAVISPDGGAEKRAGRVARKLGVPLVHAWKTRDIANGNISGFGMEQVSFSDARLLVVDDICDGGGTFLGLTTAPGALADRVDIKVDLYTTHGLYTQGTEKLLKHFAHLYCTDSVLGAPREGVIEVNVCELLLTKGHI